MSVQKEIDMIALAHKMDQFTMPYVVTPEEAKAMAEAGADVIIAHVGCTIGGSIGVTDATISMDGAVGAVQSICDAVHSVRKDVMVLSHGGPILTPEHAAYVNEHTDAVGFVGASSLERMAVETPLTELTQRFKSIPVKRIK